MQTALGNLIGAYERDFAKYPDVKEYPKISMIWRSMPSQLARDKVVKEGAQARAIDFLQNLRER